MLGLKRDEVQVVPYDARWPAAFEEEARRLRAVMGPVLRAIEHIGSTAIPGLHAKPLIDLMVGVDSVEEALALVPRLEREGYEHRPNAPPRLFLAKGPQEQRTHYISITELGSDFWQERLLFRDYLRHHPEAADAYRQLKQELASRHVTDRAAYRVGKDRFVADIVRRAREAAGQGPR